MKKMMSLFLCILLVCSIGILPVKATESNDLIINQTVEYLDDGSYFVETISESSVQLFSNTKTGTKTAKYYTSSNTLVYSVKVTGTFSYDGSSAEATDAVGMLLCHVSDATPISLSDYTSGASAIATGSVTYNGATLRKTVTLTCDKNGNLS